MHLAAAVVVIVAATSVVTADATKTVSAEADQKQNYDNPRAVIEHLRTPPFVYTLSYGNPKKMFIAKDKFFIITDIWQGRMR